MRRPEQLLLAFAHAHPTLPRGPGIIGPIRSAGDFPAGAVPVAPPFSAGADAFLTETARQLLAATGTRRLAEGVRVEWNSRMRSCAGRADYKDGLITLNPRLREYGEDEIDRTVRHEAAHLLAQFRAGRRRIPPHGDEWRRACSDLGIANEERCHNLPLPVRQRSRRFLYRCPKCNRDFPRVRRIRRATACLSCCRAHNHGQFHPAFRLKLISVSRQSPMPNG